MKTTIAVSLACLILGFATIGCSEAERTYDCASICDSYATCLDSGLDKTDCTNKCEDEAEADADFEAKANACEDCLDDESCSEAALDCATKCAEVVLVSTSGQGGAQD